MRSYSLDDVRATRKRRDSWWTVFMVDPVACRVALFVANRTEITPNALTRFSLVLGMASAACFAANRLVLGAVLFYVSFMIDCVDGKIARLKGTGTPFGLWLDYVGDRIRVICCAFGIAYGQYAATGRLAYVLLGAGIAILDLFRYVNAPQMKRVRQTVKLRRRIARREELAAVRDAMAVESLDQGPGYDMTYSSSAPDLPDHAYGPYEGYGSYEPYDQMASPYEPAVYEIAERDARSREMGDEDPGAREYVRRDGSREPGLHVAASHDGSYGPGDRDGSYDPGDREPDAGSPAPDGHAPGLQGIAAHGATIPRQASVPGDSLTSTQPISPGALSHAPPSPRRAPYDQERAPLPEGEAPVAMSARERLIECLARHRVRTHLMSGIEFHAAVFVVAPLLGSSALLPVTTGAGALLVLNEIFLVYRMWLSTRALAGQDGLMEPDQDDQRHVRTDPFFTGV
ncbi:CDP-alcohol phosphatidyltransferase family protein [Sphaerisporangium sp. NPDC049002]|uniref:CDP-alcohol phosphatidyltransferase family protein n=1 Tax=Sphaerisporangium sp. NPDC049002 TaxID=3155392 RepID=UPI0033E13899